MTYKQALNLALPIRIAITTLLFILSVGELFDGVLDAGDFAAPLLLALFINDVQSRPQGNPPVVVNKLMQSRWDIALKILIVLIILMSIVSEFYMIDPVLRKTILKYSTLIWGLSLLTVSIIDLRNSFNLMKVLYCHLAVGVMFFSITVM
jgi:hypothetical protein